jgi:hypothetical protein
MFIAKINNEKLGLAKYLAYYPGMGWYLTSDDCLAYPFASRERRRAAAVWRGQRSAFASGWSPKVTYHELERG